MQTYNIYKKKYDKEAKASSMQEKDYCYIIQPKVDHQGSKILIRNFGWIGPEVLEEISPNENEMVRKIETKKT